MNEICRVRRFMLASRAGGTIRSFYIRAHYSRTFESPRLNVLVTELPNHSIRTRSLTYLQVPRRGQRPRQRSPSHP